MGKVESMCIVLSTGAVDVQNFMGFKMVAISGSFSHKIRVEVKKQHKHRKQISFCHKFVAEKTAKPELCRFSE